MGRKVPVEEDRRFLVYHLQRLNAPHRCVQAVRRLADKARLLEPCGQCGGSILKDQPCGFTHAALGGWKPSAKKGRDA